MAKKESIYKSIARDTLANVIPKFSIYNEAIGDKQTKVENKVIQYIVQNSDKLYEEGCNINPTIIFTFIIEQRYLFELCELVRKGNLDLEIMLIDTYQDRASIIARKLGVNIDIESFLMEVIEKYDGSTTMNMFICNELKSIRNGKILERSI